MAFDIEDTPVIPRKRQHTIVGAVDQNITILVDCHRDLEWSDSLYIGKVTNVICDIDVGAAVL